MRLDITHQPFFFGLFRHKTFVNYGNIIAERSTGLVQFRMHSVVSVRRRVQGGVLRERVRFVLCLSPTLSVCVFCMFVRRFVVVDIYTGAQNSDMIIIFTIRDNG